MALSLGVAFGEDEAAEETVVEINDTNVTNATTRHKRVLTINQDQLLRRGYSDQTVRRPGSGKASAH